ncbi:MAG: hypothetical protein SFZ24_07195 [Planctomycetota bacterium]|nr:hypothetical protein [Planctomycetota bacterium]
MSPRGVFQFIVAAWAIWLGALLSAAHAMPAPTPAIPGAVAPPVPADAGEVAVRVETFGVGDLVRAGDWAGLRLAVLYRGDRPAVDAAVRLHLRDADGDTALYTRFVTLSPGREVGVWLYARMPWDLAQGSVLRVSISEASAREDGSFDIGRQLGWSPIVARQVAPQGDALAAVIGAGTAALEQYGVTSRGTDLAPGAHEIVRLVSGLRPDLLPDQWMGLSSFETILWSEGDPSTIPGGLQVEALREWINRGGHLIVIIPPVGNAWTSASNPLADLLPAATIERVSEATLGGYRFWLTGGLWNDERFRTPIHRFVRRPDATTSEMTPLIVGPHGCVAARRIVGAGMVTHLGVDLNARALQQREPLRADALWPRIIGRRAAAPSLAESEVHASRGMVRPNAPPAWVDARIGELISKSREAGVGVLLGLSVFITYWLVAGPLGYTLLKTRSLERHSWALFVVVAAAFTGIAWAGAQALRPKQAQSWHYTVLDHVFGEPVQRARVFASVLLPTYGQQRVAIGEDGADQSWRQAITPWSTPDAEPLNSFPDARGYTINVRQMTSIDAPARATIKTFQGDWLGGPRWSMPRPVSEDRAPLLRRGGAAGDRLEGALTHGLPAPLQSATLVLVRRQVVETILRRREMPTPPPLVAEAFAWKIDRWEPHTPLDLSRFTINDGASVVPVLEALVPRMVALDPSLPRSVTTEMLEEAAALFGVLNQPDATRANMGLASVPAHMRRRSVQGLDLAKWFTQPCLIIIGHVADQPSPVPMSVDGAALNGRERPSSGRTVIRWVYPLAPEPLVLGGGPGASSQEPRAD